jgi:hypothetical protein
MEKAHSADAWTIDYSAGKKCVSISTNHYHADPLKLSVDQLRNMLQILDPTEKPVAPSADLKAVKTKTSPFFGISKREKTFFIVIPEGWSGLLEFTRLDLYKFSGMMSKRVKAGKRPKQIN